MPACSATTRPGRSWPTCWATSAPVAERELTGDPLLELPEFRTGKNGIEKVYDQALRGRAGLSRFEVNALGREIKELHRHDGEPGQDLTLTIDLDLQRYVHQRLSAEESASAVVLDVHSGDVLALVSVPTFDPAGFTNGLSRDGLARAHHQPQGAAGQQGDRRPVSAGLDLQDDRGAGGARGRRRRPRPRGLLPGLHAARPAQVPLLEALGPRHAQAGRCARPVLRRLLLRPGAPRRRRRDRHDGAPLRARRDARDRPAGRAPGPGAGPGVEAGDPRRALAARRDPDRRHRPGLHAGDAAAARGDDRADRQRRPRGRPRLVREPSRAPGGARGARAGACGRRLGLVVPVRPRRACTRSSTASAAPPVRRRSPIPSWRSPARPGPRRCGGSAGPSARPACARTRTRPGRSATTPCSSPSRPIASRATRSRWWSSTAAAAARPRRRSRATSWPRRSSSTPTRSRPPLTAEREPAPRPPGDPA